MSIWADIERKFQPAEAQISQARALAAEYESSGAIPLPQTRLLDLSDAVIIEFYSILAQKRSSRSPVAKEADSRWMLRSDFCYVNVRATGKGETPGSFLSAAKILPAIRADAIHMAPFHPYLFDVLYATESIQSVAPRLAHPALSEAGFTAEDQCRAFVEACHLLEKTVGYDLTPHVAQFSRAVLERPDLFRWIELSEDRSCLAPGWTHEVLYSREGRLSMAAKVYEAVAEVKRDFGADSLEISPSDDAAKRARKDKAYYMSIKVCIDRGLWPVLAHAWRGVGIPEFLRYDRRGNYPIFRYMDESGTDVGNQTFSVVTPYAFYDDIPPNRPPRQESSPNPWEPSIARYAGGFRRWRDEFGFDFVRYDSVDHVFDSTLNEGEDQPVSDRPTPAVLRRVIHATREGGNERVGALAERLGGDFEAYAALGFDLILGNESLRRMDAPLMEDSFALYDRLAAFNKGRAHPASVCFAVDTHDTGDPHLWGAPLVAALGRERLRLRHFLSRFLSCGAAPRPKYETMGFQDLSYGLYEANVEDVNLRWMGDEAFAAGYETIEAVYRRFKPFMDRAYISDRGVRSDVAYWIFRSSDPSRVLVAVASLETEAGQAVGRLEIPLAPGVKDSGFEGRVYDFRDANGRAFCARDRLILENLEFLGFRIFDVTIGPSHFY